MKNRGRGYGAADRVAWRILALAVLALCMAPLVARAQPVVDPTTVPAAAEATDAPADLVVANRQIVTLRASVLGGTPGDRVTAITERLNALLDRGGGTPAVATSEVEGGYLIKVNGEPVFRVLDADVPADSSQSTRQLAEQTAAHLTQALSEIAEARDARALLPAIGWRFSMGPPVSKRSSRSTRSSGVMDSKSSSRAGMRWSEPALSMAAASFG